MPISGQTAALIFIAVAAILAYFMVVGPRLTVRKEKKSIKDFGFFAKSKRIIEDNKKYILTEMTLPTILQAIVYKIEDQNSNIELKPKFHKEILQGDKKTVIYKTRALDNMAVIVKTGLRGWDYYDTNDSPIIET
ncbi:MAG: hypothetical protein WC788_04615 [Candidatus Paceibacterota bacterium]|jgi:hypothetical protein